MNGPENQAPLPQRIARGNGEVLPAGDKEEQ